ncbi:hypothetical protein Tco_0622360 [Tanacetum coccineum]
MVAYLKKPKGSEGFHQIVDFLNASHIRTLDNGEIELTATIDGKVKTVIEASVRRHLQLAYANCISSFPTTKIFEQLSLMGENIPLFPAMIVQGSVVQGKGSTHPVESHHTPTSAPSTLQPPISPTFRRTTRQESVVPQPRSLTQTPIADEAASIGVDVRYGVATTTVTSLEEGYGSGNIDNTHTMPHDSPLPRKVESLEIDLKQTKQIYGASYTRLIKRVKKLEKTVKSSQTKRRARIVVSDDEDDLEDPSKQGRKLATIDQDPGILLVQHDAKIQGRYGHDMEFNLDVSTAEPVSTAGAAVTTASVAVSTTRNTGVSTADDITIAETLVYIRKSAAKDKVAVRLHAELEEEERQRIARVHESASSFNVEEWEDIQARVEADEELVEVDRAVLKLTVESSKRDIEEELDQESSKRQKSGESPELAEEPIDKEADELSQ